MSREEMAWEKYCLLAENRHMRVIQPKKFSGACNMARAEARKLNMNVTIHVFVDGDNPLGCYLGGYCPDGEGCPPHPAYTS